MLQGLRSSGKYILGALFIAFVVGFLLMDTSGLLGRSGITATTAVATVNGEEIPVTQWYKVTQELEQQASQSTGKSLTMDDRKQLSNRAFDQLVLDILLKQEYERRGITVTKDEIQQAARYAPPPQVRQSPELLTEGQFDINKYHRFLDSPNAKQSGFLNQLEAYYRNEIPRQKLYEQIVGDIYLTDNRLWNAWKDYNDSASVSYVMFDPRMVPDQGITVSDAEIKSYYDKHKSEFTRPGRAIVSVLLIPRPESSDTAATDSSKIDPAASRMNDSLAAIADKKADSLTAIASPDKPNGFNEAARTLKLQPIKGEVVENEPFAPTGKYIAGVSGWAFSGVKQGEISDLQDSDNAYFVARLDSLIPGGEQSLDAAKTEIREILVNQKKLDKLVSIARKFASEAAATSLEQSATANKLRVSNSGSFTRLSAVTGLGSGTETMGAAFALPVGAISAPIKTRDGVYVMRVDSRKDATRADFEAQIAQTRSQQLQAVREARVQEYLQLMKKNAKIKDHRKDIEAATQQASS